MRTPFGKLGGGLAAHTATELGAIAIRAGLERAGIEPDEVGYVVMGQVLQAGAGQAPARQAAVGAGIPKEVPADTINKVCASSVRAVELADLMIRAGDHDVVVTGGMESMSNAPYLLPKGRFGYRLGHGEVLDHMVYDGLSRRSTGCTWSSRPRSSAASSASRARIRTRGRTARTSAPRPRRTRAGSTTRSSPSAASTADESVRRDTTLEKLAALPPVFDPEGTTTAGNAPGVNDGASCVVVCSEEFAQRRGLEPLATILAHGYVADDFAYLARTPGERRGGGAARRPGRRSTTSRGSRSTRRSHRWRRTRPGCSASTRRS